MTLSPCPRCRRHVVVDDQHCPFCGTSRWSRVAILAGALALPACGGATPATTGPASADPPRVSNRAPRTATAKITGIVTNTRTRGPLLDGYVTLVGPDGLERSTGTDASGRYEFADLEAGEYTLDAPASASRREKEDDRRPRGVKIVVHDGETVQHDLSTWVMDPRVKMPYGAPPARARVV